MAAGARRSQRTESGHVVGRAPQGRRRGQSQALPWAAARAAAMRIRWRDVASRYAATHDVEVRPTTWRRGNRQPRVTAWIVESASMATRMRVSGIAIRACRSVKTHFR